MRRAAAAVLMVLALALGLGLLRLSLDVEEEVRGAQALAEMMAALQALENVGDEEALARLQSLAVAQRLRHLQVAVRDDQSRLRWSSGEVPADGPLHSWPLRRPSGEPWTISLGATDQAERSEAAVNLAGALALLVLAALALLLVVRSNVNRAFRPLRGLLAAIDGVERDDPTPLHRLPTMPIAELESLAAALRHLATSLEAAQARRRVLAQQVFTLQEDERARLARELHDEMGQRLTSMRVDAAWLVRKLPADDERRAVVLNLERQCEDLQVDVRQLLVRLRPLGTMGALGPAGDPAVEPVSRVVDLIEGLARAWSTTRAHGLQIQTEQVIGSPNWTLPRPVVLAVFRMTQEALTNVARHAQAQTCRVTLVMDTPGRLEWTVEDDGTGLGPSPSRSLERGSGLAGMRERAWSLGSELDIAPARDGSRPGLRLRAVFRWECTA